LDKEFKKQIKEDEFQTAITHAFDWSKLHSAEVRITAGVAVILAIVLGGVGYSQGSQRKEAERAFAEAVDTFSAAVRPPGDAAAAGGKSFATAQEKYTQAVAAFDGLARRFPTRSEGLRARYLAALSRVEIGQYQEAEKALTEIAADRRASALEPALARLALADLYRRSGQTDKAVTAFRDLAADTTSAVPRDTALMSLAGTLEDAKRLAEARVSYKRLSEEFPQSVYAAEARRRADRLAPAVES
jgi:tetratricopeptide (TPR) repeat protein